MSTRGIVTLSTWDRQQGSGFELTEDDLIVSLTGPSVPAGVNDLRTELRDALGREILFQMRSFPYTSLITTRGTD